jgi:hypothetical protein
MLQLARAVVGIISDILRLVVLFLRHYEEFAITPRNFAKIRSDVGRG